MKKKKKMAVNKSKPSVDKPAQADKSFDMKGARKGVLKTKAGCK